MMEHNVDLVKAVEALKAWLPSEDPSFVELVGSILASLPGGEALEGLDFPAVAMGWKELELLVNLLNALYTKYDVAYAVKMLFLKEENKECEKSES